MASLHHVLATSWWGSAANQGYEAVLSALHPGLRPAQSQLFTSSNGSHTRCKAVFPGIEVSISILQCKFPSFSAKSVHPSVNLPTTPRSSGRLAYPELTLLRRRIGVSTCERGSPTGSYRLYPILVSKEPVSGLTLVSHSSPVLLKL